ncbi:MAG: hypothetical protein HQM08_27315 [Candidatus Riflebacteria bacterium]|nr:hypothetical protein [Candidatus Riflebacteria bacterium]
MKKHFSTTVQLSNRWGVTSKTINVWASKWLAPAKISYGKFDDVLSHKLYIENVIKPEFNQGSNGEESIDESKRRKEKALADKAELQAKQLSESLIPKDQAIDWVIELVVEAKSAFRSIPRRIAPVIYGKEIRDIEGIISDEIDDALRKLARPVKKEKNVKNQTLKKHQN